MEEEIELLNIVAEFYKRIGFQAKSINLTDSDNYFNIITVGERGKFKLKLEIKPESNYANSKNWTDTSVLLKVEHTLEQTLEPHKNQPSTFKFINITGDKMEGMFNNMIEAKKNVAKSLEVIEIMIKTKTQNI